MYCTVCRSAETTADAGIDQSRVAVLNLVVVDRRPKQNCHSHSHKKLDTMK